MQTGTQHPYSCVSVVRCILHNVAITHTSISTTTDMQCHPLMHGQKCTRAAQHVTHMTCTSTGKDTCAPIGGLSHSYNAPVTPRSDQHQYASHRLSCSKPHNNNCSIQHCGTPVFNSRVGTALNARPKMGATSTVQLRQA